MPARFFDSSALAKRYVQERGSSWLVQLFDATVLESRYAARITEVEVAAALARKKRDGTLSAADAAKALLAMGNDFAHSLQIVEVTPALVAHAVTLTGAHNLRAYDAVQLAAVLEVHKTHVALGQSGVALISADADLNAAASAEGLTVDDPNAHP